MPKLTKQQTEKIEKIRERKKRVCEKVQSILKDICDDNPEMFKKQPEARDKALRSIVNKMRSIDGCNIGNIEDHVDDIAGARVTCCTKDEIPTAIKLIKRHPDIKTCRILKELQVGSDDFGYRGHHLLVEVEIFWANRRLRDSCEVQIRTLAMDLWAVLSHRDFYKSAFSAPPPLVQEDMKTLSKVLQVVDDLAVTLKQRRREEIDRKLQEKEIGRVRKDMLTPDNLQKLAKKLFNEEISLDQAYDVIRPALMFNLRSLSQYRKLIATNSPHQKAIRKLFSENNVEPELTDCLHGPIMLQFQSAKSSRDILMRRIRTIQQKKGIKSVEKGVEIGEEELRREKKTSQPQRKQKK